MTRPRKHIAPATDTPVIAAIDARERAPTAEIRLGRWEDVLADVRPDTVIVDAPYSDKTHGGAMAEDDSTSDGVKRLGIDYACWDRADVEAFVTSWAPRTACWIVSITDHVLAPMWLDAYEAAGFYAFAPVGIVINAMGVRMMADGPASWTLYGCMGRRRARRLSWVANDRIWRSIPGGYSGGFAGHAAGGDAGGGRGKPRWLLDALVRDYSDPGMTVCDPCAGWGSTLVAARNAGRSAIGAEMDPAAFERCRHALSGDMTAYRRSKPPREREPDPDRPGLFDTLEATP